MFYRLWIAAKRRPTRALGIASIVLIAGAAIHAVFTSIAVTKAATGPTTPIEIYEGRVVRMLLLANVGAFLDSTALLIGLGSGAAYFWRKWRGLK